MLVFFEEPLLELMEDLFGFLIKICIQKVLMCSVVCCIEVDKQPLQMLLFQLVSQFYGLYMLSLQFDRQ